MHNFPRVEKGLLEKSLHIAVQCQFIECLLRK